MLGRVKKVLRERAIQRLHGYPENSLVLFTHNKQPGVLPKQDFIGVLEECDQDFLNEVYFFVEVPRDRAA